MFDPKDDEKEGMEVLRKLQSVEMEPAPYLETRVLAHLKEKNAKVGSFWKKIALSSSALSAVLVVALLVKLPQTEFVAFVAKPFVVRVSVTDLAEAKIARAEIVLPDGVYFDIEQFPELKNQRSLSLAWNSEKQSEFVPFVLNSDGNGLKTVRVRFFSANGDLVKEKEIPIRLKEQA